MARIGLYPVASSISDSDAVLVLQGDGRVRKATRIQIGAAASAVAAAASAAATAAQTASAAAVTTANAASATAATAQTTANAALPLSGGAMTGGIVGGTLNNAPIGGTTRAAGAFTEVAIGAAVTAVATRLLTLVQPVVPITTTSNLVRIGGNFFGANLSASFTGPLIKAVMDSDDATFTDVNHAFTSIYFGQALIAGWSGGRTLAVDFLNVTGAGTAGVDAYHVAGSSEVRMAASAGGVPGGLRGSPFARNEMVMIKNGAGPHYQQIFADEFDVAVESETGVFWKGGVKVVYLTNDALRGKQEDYAYSLGLQSGGTSPGVGIAYAIGGVEGWFPLTETSAVMQSVAGSVASGPAYAIGVGVDFSNLTRIRESAFKSPGLKVDGSGNLGALVASGLTLQTRDQILAKTAVVNTVEVLDGGLYGGAITLTLDGTATAAVNAWGIIDSNSIAANGTLWTVGDTFTVSGGTAAAAAAFTGSIADNVLTVSAISSGAIVNRSVLVGDVIHGTRVIAFGTGTGGVGTYIVDTSQVKSSRAITSGGPAIGVVTRIISGGVQSFRITNPGRYTVLPTSPVSVTTGGTGTGFTFSTMHTILSVNVTAAGSAYSEFLPPFVSSSGSSGTFKAATFRVTMTGTQGPLSLNPGGSVLIGTQTPASAASSGTTGTVAWDASFIYVATATNTWKRVALVTW